MVKTKRVRLPYHKQALGEQIEDPESQGVRTKPRRGKRRKTAGGSDDEGGEDEAFVSGPLSARILKEARAQQEELEAEAAPGGLAARAAVQRGGSKGARGGAAAAAASDSDDDSLDADPGAWGEEAWGPEDEEEVSPEDEAALAAFMAPGAENFRQRTLADVILEKVRQKQDEQGLSAIPREGEEAEPAGLDPKVVEVYCGVGAVLSRYTAGKVPKAFKLIPNLTNWEEILQLTEPEGWTPHALYQGTRLFVSNLNAKMAQRFLVLVLLPAVRRDIRENQRLHFALFQALRKATYKAGAFYKGILLPLCASGSCTLREAFILTSVIRRTSIPVLHSAAALLRIAEMPYSGTNSFFIRVLLDKRYALPYRVIDALVDHFTRFSAEERQVPVVWHQALLCFVQRYKGEVRAEDKDALRALCRRQFHYLVTPEVVRELDASRSRGEAAPGAEAMRPQSQVGARAVEDPRALAPIVMMDD